MKKANAPAPADVQVLLPAAMMNGKAVVDSREVARMLGRPHKNLLADIHRYISAMERRKADGLNFQPVARDFQLVDFFVPSTYTIRWMATIQHAPGIAEMEAETRRNNSRLKLAQMWLAMAETAGKAKKAHYRQCAENALLGKA